MKSMPILFIILEVSTRCKPKRRKALLFRSLFLVEIDADDAAVGRQCVEGFFGFEDSGIEATVKEYLIVQQEASSLIRPKTG